MLDTRKPLPRPRGRAEEAVEADGRPLGRDPRDGGGCPRAGAGPGRCRRRQGRRGDPRRASKEGEDALKVRSDEDIAAIREWSQGRDRPDQGGDGRPDHHPQVDARGRARGPCRGGRAPRRRGRGRGRRLPRRHGRLRRAPREEEDPSYLATMAESMPEPPSFEAPGPATSRWAIPGRQVEARGRGRRRPEAARARGDRRRDDRGRRRGSHAEPWRAEVEAVGRAGRRRGRAAWRPRPSPRLIEAIGESSSRGHATRPEPSPSATLGTPSPTRGRRPAPSPRPGPWGEGTTWRPGGDRRRGRRRARAGPPARRPKASRPAKRAAIPSIAARSWPPSRPPPRPSWPPRPPPSPPTRPRPPRTSPRPPPSCSKDRHDGEDELDPEAHAAMAARVDAGGFEESYTDRLAKLLPDHADGAPAASRSTTQVIVSGLVSVASIASFKRHLGRIAGVKGVAVASGPEGEFVFNVTHRPDVSFRDAIPTMPGFAARVTGTADGDDPGDGPRSRGGGVTRDLHGGHAPPSPSCCRRPSATRSPRSCARGASTRSSSTSPEELEGILVSRRDVTMAVLDIVGDLDDGIMCWALLHERDRNIPSLLVVDNRDARPPRLRRAGPRGRRVHHPPLLRRVDPLARRGDVHPLGRRRRRQRPGAPERHRRTSSGASAASCSACSTRRAASARRRSPPTSPRRSSRKGQRVLLIDADTVTGHVSTSLGMEAVPTVIDAWRDEVEGGPVLTFVEQASVHSSGLKVLPLSSHPLNTELLEPQRVVRRDRRRAPRLRLRHRRPPPVVQPAQPARSSTARTGSWSR